MTVPIILASSSPRRKALLAQIVDKFSVESASVDETAYPQESPQTLVERLSKLKAKVIADSHANSIVIGSDTVVAIDGTVFGKPLDFDDFRYKLQQLAGNWHQVFTGVCIFHQQKCLVKVVTSNVKMSPISEQDMLSYWQTNEPLDKAGGYAIQGIGGQFVEKINGSYSAVVGLPLFETKQLLAQALHA